MLRCKATAETLGAVPSRQRVELSGACGELAGMSAFALKLRRDRPVLPRGAGKLPKIYLAFFRCVSYIWTISGYGLKFSN